MSYQEAVDAMNRLTTYEQDTANLLTCYLNKINKLEQNTTNLLAQTANVNTEISNENSDLEIVEEKPRYEVKPMVNLYEEYGIERLVVPWEENH